MEGKAVSAVFGTSSGIWYPLRPAQDFTGVRFWTNGDLPISDACIG